VDEESMRPGQWLGPVLYVLLSALKFLVGLICATCSKMFTSRTRWRKNTEV